MKSSLAGLILFILLQPVFAIESEVREQMEQSTVRIEAKVTFIGDVTLGGQTLISQHATRQLPNPHGSGFVISDYHIATNSHVAFEREFFANQIARQITEEAGLNETLISVFATAIIAKIAPEIEYFVVLSQTEKMPAEVVWRSSPKDLAILKTESLINRPIVSFAPATVVEDLQDVFVLGFPGSADYMGSTESPYIVNRTKGVISKRFFDDIHQRHLYATDAAINPGNSGGPMFDACGNVVGVSVEKAALENTEGAGFVIQIDELFPAMTSLEIAYNEAASSCLSGYVVNGMAFSPNNLIFIGSILFLTLLLLGGLVWLKKSSSKKMNERDVSMLINQKLAGEKKNDSEAVSPTSENQASESDEIRQIKLVAEGENWPPVYLQGNEPLKLGAGRHCDIVLDHRHISGEHVSIQAVNGKVMVKDLDSTNGTYINARKLPTAQAVPFQPGERLILGTEKVVYRLDSRNAAGTGHYIAILTPKTAGLSTIKISEEKMVLGRDEGDIRIENTFLSSRHAMLWMEGGKLQVQDLDSYNGTFINNSKQQLQPKKTVTVNSGDWLIFGSKDVIYEVKY